MKRLQRVVPDAVLSTSTVLLAVVCSQLWIVVSAKVLATQMSARVVDTQYGKLRGVLVTLSNRRLPLVEAYLGLQYASLLGGELRFMPPTSTTEKWDGIRVALRYRPVCPQTSPPSEGEDGTSLRADHIERLRPFLERQSEDCLNLNIYVPAIEGTHSNHHHHHHWRRQAWGTGARAPLEFANARKFCRPNARWLSLFDDFVTTNFGTRAPRARAPPRSKILGTPLIIIIIVRTFTMRL